MAKQEGMEQVLVQGLDGEPIQPSPRQVHKSSSISLAHQITGKEIHEKQNTIRRALKQGRATLRLKNIFF